MPIYFPKPSGIKKREKIAKELRDNKGIAYLPNGIKLFINLDNYRDQDIDEILFKFVHYKITSGRLKSSGKVWNINVEKHAK